MYNWTYLWRFLLKIHPYLLGTCQVHEVFETHAGTCDEPYSWDAEDQTPHFAPGWRQTNQNSSYNSDCSAWHYKTTAELKTRPFLGNLALYRGGGYKVDLGSTTNEAYSVLSDLKSNGWVDKYTRAVFVEFTVYNGHSNLYCVANLLLEFTAAGGVLPFIQLLSTRIDRYVGHFLIFVLVCEVSFVLFTLLFTYREFKRFLKTELKNYMTQFWTWIELLLIGLSWTAIVLYGIRFGLDKYTKKTFRENPRQFVDFHHLALVDQLFGYVYAFVVFTTSVKFLRLFRFNRRMSLLGCTIKAAARELAHFGIIFGLVFIGFSHLCYLVFSHELYKFHTFVTTLETLISVMLGKFSYVSLERTNRVLGPIMFFFYSIGVVFILINMFLSIIIENFKKVKQDNDLQSNEHEIIDFMTDQFLNWLGLKSRSIFKTRVAPEEECTRPRYKKLKSIDEAQQLKERVDRLVTLIKEVHFDVQEEEDFLRNDGEVTYLVP